VLLWSSEIIWVTVTFLTRKPSRSWILCFTRTFAALVWAVLTPFRFNLVDGKVYTSLPELVKRITCYQKFGAINRSEFLWRVEINECFGSACWICWLGWSCGINNNFYYYRNSEATYVLETPTKICILPPLQTEVQLQKRLLFTCFQTEIVGNQILLSHFGTNNSMSKYEVGCRIYSG